MGRALFIAAILFVFAYYVFYHTVQARLGITPNTSNQLQQREMGDTGSTENNNSSPGYNYN